MKFFIEQEVLIKKSHNIIRWLPLNSFVVLTVFVVARDLALHSCIRDNYLWLYARPK